MKNANNSVSIRQAVVADVEAVVTLVNSAYRGEHAKSGWTTESALLDGQRIDREGMLSAITAPDSTVLVAENNDRSIVGCVAIKSTDEGSYIGMLTVDPLRQNSGIGRVLLEQAEHYAASLGIPRVFMTVIGVRRELIAWYERRGYKLTDQRLDFPIGDQRFGIPKVSAEDLRFVVLEKNL